MLEAEKFSKLVTESQKRLYSYIYSLTGHTASSWDVLQETNLVLWAKREEFKAGSNFNAWSHTVARFQVLAYLRDKTRDPLSLLTPEIFEKLEAESDPHLNTHDMRLKALNKCLSQLAPAASKMVRWHYEEKLPLQQISSKLSMTANAVKQALFRARRSLHECIESSLANR